MVKKRNVTDEASVVDEVKEEVSEEERARLARLEQAGTGFIEDVRTVRLMYLEKCVVESVLQVQVRRTAYESRIQVLKNEMSSVIRQWEDKQKQAVRKIADLRRELEEAYGIDMSQWGFDDDTGMLLRLPQEVTDQIDAQKDHSKLKESETGEDAPDRGDAT